VVHKFQLCLQIWLEESCLFCMTEGTLKVRHNNSKVSNRHSQFFRDVLWTGAPHLL
jgi:hypothetical protein